MVRMWRKKQKKAMMTDYEKLTQALDEIGVEYLVLDEDYLRAEAERYPNDFEVVRNVSEIAAIYDIPAEVLSGGISCGLELLGTDGPASFFFDCAGRYVGAAKHEEGKWIPRKSPAPTP